MLPGGTSTTTCNRYISAHSKHAHPLPHPQLLLLVAELLLHPQSLRNYNPQLLLLVAELLLQPAEVIVHVLKTSLTSCKKSSF